MKLNFEAAWEEVGDEFEKEETFTLSTTKTLEGKVLATVEVLLTFALASLPPGVRAISAAHISDATLLKALQSRGRGWGSCGGTRGRPVTWLN